MSKHVLIVTGLVLVLLVALAAPAMAAPIDQGGTVSSQDEWTVVEGDLSGFPWVHQPHGGCETHGNCSG
ncbi:MAG: hypothetical protein GY835_16325 [bacterium]|nr:hypothetical protein [bacterium]